MCICEFCHTPFCNRPQVKQPRACKNCQRLRQQANELEWRERHPDLYDKKYHAIKKQLRDDALTKRAELAIEYRLVKNICGLIPEPATSQACDRG